MSRFLSALRIIVTILPAVASLIKTLEQVLPIPGAGSGKLELLQGVIADVYQTLNESDRKQFSLEAVLAIAASLAARLVATFNKNGWPAADPAPSNG